ncbi:MAG TPA: hypothetical protein VF507_06525, partial [Pyrinomonadaceae bacterium]
DPWGRPDYRRNRDDDYRRNRDNGNYGYGRYDRNTLRDSVRRLKDVSGQFQRDLDRTLDRSRVNGTNREDRINDLARDFHRAASELKDRFGDGRDASRSQNQVRRLLDDYSRLSRVAQRLGGADYRISSEWSQISQEVGIIADAYGYRISDYNNGNNGYDPYGRQRDSDANRNRRNNNNNVPWYRRLPY